MNKAIGLYLACGVALMGVAAPLHMAGPAPTVERAGPRLIAHGCLGAGGDLWVSEESDLPTDCESVERWQ